MKRFLKVNLIICFILFFGVVGAIAQEANIQVKRIWDAGKHNAFPDVLYAKGYYYVALREGNSHVDNSNDGVVRIIRSKDLKKWESIALFDHDFADVREARLSLMPDGRILANLAVGLWKDGYEWLDSYVSFSNQNGTKFSTIEKIDMDKSIGKQRDWLWRLTWDRGVGYGMLYRVFSEPKINSIPWEIFLVKTTDGKKYDLVSKIPVDGNPNEATVRFDDKGKIYAMIRRESDDKLGWLGSSNQPYNSWEFNTLDWRLGGPNFIFLGKDRLIMGTRYKQTTQAKTGIFVTDLRGKVLKTIELPSAGDNSYPGVVIVKDKLIVIYYSSHEEKSAIYMAEIPVKQLYN